MSAVNALVRIVDYNSIRTKLINVLGTGSATFGWGQTIVSSSVTVGARISVQEYASLTTDVNNAYRHIFGVLPSLPAATENNLVRFNTTNAPISRFDTIVNEITDNRFTVALTSTIANGTITASWPSPTYGTFWNNQINCLVTVQFTTADQARFFFNSGGDIKFFSSRVSPPGGGTVSAQNSTWTLLLAQSGTQSFGGNKPGTGTTPANGANYYRLTGNYNIWYANTAISPYSSNVYRISARATDLGQVLSNASGIARRIDFFIEWVDNYQDITSGKTAGDRVNGTFSLTVDTTKPATPLLPSGIFVVETPTVVINTIQQLPNLPE